MIRINLLPFRAARKKENVRRQISVYLLLLLFLAALIGYSHVSFNRKLAALVVQQAEKKKELGAYAGTNKKIKEIKTKIAEVRAKLEVIRGLEKNKTGPVRLLEEISLAVPKEKLWLRSLEEKKGILKLNGSAMDNDTVAIFMTNLEKTPHILSVDLKSTKLRHMQEFKLNVTDFVLVCKTYSYKEKPKPETKKKTRKHRKRKR